VYPSSDTNLSPPLLRHAFRASSVLPGPLAAHLRAQGAALNRGARGLIYNARMVDLIRLLSLVKAYVAWASQPPPSAAEPAKPVAATAPASETTCSQAESPGASSSPALAQATSLVVFVLDRSCATPDASAAEPNSAWRRLQDRANDLIGQLARKTSGRIEIAIVAYGRDPSGAVEVQTGFAGATAGRAWIGPGEIAEGAIRVEEITEQVSDGVGGLLKIARKRPVLLDLKPTAPAAPEAALARVAEMLAQWTESHPGQRAEPIVVHCTRGQFEPDAVRQSVDRLREAERAVGPITLYHVVVTESAHRATAYPASADAIEHEALRTLWETTSPLPGGALVAGKRPGVAAGSRGMVINAPFDALADAVGGSS
jgi:hypothetical protein